MIHTEAKTKIKVIDIQSVDHKYLEPRHTYSYMEGDEDFPLIEKHKSHIQYVYVLIEWNNSIKEACKKFFVRRMTSVDFFLLSESAEKSSVNHTNKQKRMIAWRQIKWIRVQKDQLFTIRFKDTLNEN